MTIQDDEINNAEYVPVDELNEILDKDGEPLDAIEQNQSEESFEGDESGQKQLRDAIEDDNDQENKNDE